MSAVLAEVRPHWIVLKPVDIETVWPNVVNGVISALETSNGEGTVQDTKDGLLAGRTQLGILDNPANPIGVVFSIIAYPKYKVARVYLMFGKGTLENKIALEEGEALFREWGCKYVEAWVATKSRERLFERLGYLPAYTILRKPL